jgi:hypothetical protein
MGKVKCLDLEGLDCWFWSDDHDQHFHIAKKGHWEMKVHFTARLDEMFELVHGKMPKGRLRRRIIKQVLANQGSLLAELEVSVKKSWPRQS